MLQAKNVPFALTLIILFVGVSVEAENTIVDPPYTENIEQFKEKKNFNARSQKMLACWLYFKEETKKSKKDFQQFEWLHLIKNCMKKITRKQAVLKITQLGKRNLQPVAKFQTIINIESEIANAKAEAQNSQFDNYLLVRSGQFQKQLKEILEKGNIEGQIQQQLKKRQKYYFGIIPASMVNHTTVLITLSVALMCCITWCRFYKANQERRSERKLQKKAKVEEQDEQVSMIKTNKQKNKKKK